MIQSYYGIDMLEPVPLEALGIAFEKTPARIRQIIKQNLDVLNRDFKNTKFDKN